MQGIYYGFFPVYSQTGWNQFKSINFSTRSLYSINKYRHSAQQIVTRSTFKTCCLQSEIYTQHSNPQLVSFFLLLLLPLSKYINQSQLHQRAFVHFVLVLLLLLLKIRPLEKFIYIFLILSPLNVESSATLREWSKGK